MSICFHYRKNLHGKYVDIVKRKGEHLYICSRCRCKLHDDEVRRLKRRIDYLNNGYDSKIPIDISDIIWMESPVPKEYFK